MRQTRVICLSLFVITVALYIPVINHEFVNFDDGLYVTKQKIVQQGLSWAGIRWAFTGSHASNWHPVTWLAHMLDCSLFGLDASGHHLTSVLIHAVNAPLLFLLLLRMTGALWPAALVAALFAWHPLHVESVAWVAERKDVLSTFFGLLAMLAYVSYAGGGRRAAYLLSLLWYALSLMTKSMLVTLPCLLLLLDGWPLARWPNLRRHAANGAGAPAAVASRAAARTWLQLVVEKLPYVALAIAASGLTLWAQGEGRSLATLEALPFRWRCINAVTSYAAYLGKTFWPRGLAVLYPLYPDWHWTEIAVSIVVLGAVTAMALVRLRRQPYLAAGWFWFLGTLVPVIGLVQVGSQSMADRYTYVPLTGVFLMVAWSLRELVANRPHLRTTVTTGVAAMLLACVGLSRLQLRHWQDDFTLFGHAIAVTKHNYVAYSNLASGLLDLGQIERSIACLEEALRIRPDHVSSHVNLGIALSEVGRFDEAQVHFTTALRLDPNRVQANYFTGVSLASQNRYAEAEPYLLRAIELAPEELYYRYGVALVMARQNDLAAAARQFAEVLRRNPGDDAALYNLGVILARQGRIPEAIAHLEDAIRLNPDSIETLRSLAWMLATANQARCRNGARAVQYAERAVSLGNAPDPLALDTLAAACAEAGRFDMAIRTAQQALTLAVQEGKSKLAADIRSRLQLYEAGRAYHEAGALP